VWNRERFLRTGRVRRGKTMRGTEMRKGEALNIMNMSGYG
jgi:hypothetical protein